MAQFRAHSTVAVHAPDQEIVGDIPEPGLASQPERESPEQALEDSPGPMKRLEFRVNESFLEGLDGLANAEGRTRTDILRRALGLYARAYREKVNNRYLAFAEITEDNTLNVTELITL